MSVVIIRRPPRKAGPEPPKGELLLEPPPELAEAAGGANLGMGLMYLPMAIGPALFMFTTGASTATYVMGGVYVLGSMAMAGALIGRGGGDKRRKIDADRRDYLRYLGQIRRRVRRAAAQQRAAQYWHHPDPSTLWSIATGTRLWERRPGDRDFTDVRVAVGRQRLAVPLVAPDTKPIEDLEPLCAGALRSLLSAHSSVPALPVAISLSSFARIGLGGDQPARDELLRAILAQLATFHAPDDLRMVVCAAEERLGAWEWLKWVPHALHPTLSDAAGPLRLVGCDLAVLEVLLEDDLCDRPRLRPGDPRPAEQPQLVIVLDGGRVPADSDLLAGLQGVTILDLVETSGAADLAPALRLRVVGAELRVDGISGGGTLGVADQLTLGQAEALARQLAPLRTSGTDDTFDPLVTELGLPELLGIGDPTALDVTRLWQSRAARDRLRIPIGVAENGAPVELDIKESAQGGMGPHGLLVGATGSGKSELLRTLVLGLALTHSPEVLNFVLVDFKGGATFLGLDRLPHTSAVITNLAQELPLVDRMHDALHGELIRRQELLRACGNLTSQREYERARERDATLAALPSLFVVVDEFSELLSSKPEFAELFVMIGRLGRSLGVHLLLASQRLDEGRLRGLETHLSYRLGLRMFSGVESRAVLGVPDAHELPATPGSGFLRLDTSTLVRFKAAYVSGPARTLGDPRPGMLVPRAVVPYRITQTGTPAAATHPERDEDTVAAQRVIDVVAAQLEGHGPPAHQVWLPPLGEPSTLDSVLPPLVPHPHGGLTVAGDGLRGRLRVPVGIVDRPFEQRHDVLWADLSGAGGHAVVVGRPQSGKSTLLRTLLCGLALTHTASEVQLYCLDFGGGGLAALARLPHVGGVATRREPDVVRRTIAEFVSLLDRRERVLTERRLDSFDDYRAARERGEVDDPYGDVFLVLDGLQTFRGEFEALEPAVIDLAARGLGYGIHVIVTANRWIEVRPALRDLLGTRFELRLGEPFESEMNRRAAANVPERQPGRGITREGLQFATALPRIDGIRSVVDLGDGVRRLLDAVVEHAHGAEAPPVRLLPTRLEITQLPPASPTRVPIGIDENELGSVELDFAAESHLLVLGDSQSGKSNVLRLIASAITTAHHPQDARIIALDYRRGLYDVLQGEHVIGYAASRTAAEPIVADVLGALHERLSKSDASPEQLRAGPWWRGAQLYLLVDDFELVESAAGNPLHPLLDLVPQARDVGLHLIVARSSGGAARAFFEPFLQRLKEVATPTLVLSGGREEGVAAGDVKFQPLPPGRGTLVSRRLGARVIQTALLTAES